MSDPQGDSAAETTSQEPAQEKRRSVVHKYLASIAATAIIIVLGYLAQPYVKLLGPPERCWEIREVEGRLYKVNPCTGQFRLLGDAQEPEDKR